MRRPPQLIAICLSLAACFSPRIPEGSVCTNVCPADETCVDGRCVRGGTGVDAGADEAAVCPPGYMVGFPGSSQYRIAFSSATQPAAVADCADDGPKTHLVIVDNDFENMLIDALASEDTWLGITDAAAEDTWVTVLGTPQTFLPWGTGQPNGGANENCAYVANEEWQDTSCTLPRPYICECR